MKTIITGITGQDGCYLAQKLSLQGHKIFGIVRNVNQEYRGFKYLGIDNVEIIESNLENKGETEKLIKQIQPDFYYNLAAQSSVGESFVKPHNSILFNIHSTLNALEAIRVHSQQTKFYQATSSEMYGAAAKLPITENTLLHPQSPYAISKAACHHLVRNYRESYSLKACSGILFNHESVLRRNNFFIMKVIKTGLDIKNDVQDELRVGNIDIKRDFGYAPKYVDAMILMMDQNNFDDYIICSGKSITLRSIIEHIFNCLNISLDRVVEDQQFFRPSEIQDIYGDNSRAKRELGWDYDISFYDVVESILEEYLASFYNE